MKLKFWRLDLPYVLSAIADKPSWHRIMKEPIVGVSFEARMIPDDRHGLTLTVK